MRYQKLIHIICFRTCLAVCIGTIISGSLSGCRPRPLPVETACPGIYMPVCAADGKTYSNSCEALKAGQFRYQDGECES